MSIRAPVVQRTFEAECGAKVRYLGHELFTKNAEQYLEIRYSHRKDRVVCCRLDGSTLAEAAREIGRAAATDAEEA